MMQLSQERKKVKIRLKNLKSNKDTAVLAEDELNYGIDHWNLGENMNESGNDSKS